MHGVAAGVEHMPLLRHFRPGTVVDIGANRGQFALATRCSVANARVVSFEPLPGPGQAFQRVFAGDPQVSLIQAAVGPQRREMPFHVSRRDDSSSLLPISEVQSEMFPGTEEQELVSVPVAPLAELVNADELVGPVMLKIDVQGFELEALRGCESLLDRFEWLYVECSYIELYQGQALVHEVIDWLQSRGFRLAGVYNPCHDPDGIAVQADFLFSRSSSA